MRQQKIHTTLLFGLSTGLAVSAQYKGLLLILLYLIFPLLLSDLEKRRLYKHISMSLGIILPVFLLINFPILLDPANFYNGIAFESRHVTEGHTLKISPVQHLFGFHLMNSLIPGISLSVTFFALFGIACTIYKWKGAERVDKLLAVYTALFYFAHELSPMKAAPDYMRYMILITPSLIFFAGKFVYYTNMTIKGISKRWAVQQGASALMAVMIILPLYDTVLLDYYLRNDTRIEAEEWVSSRGGRAVYEYYATAKKADVWSVAAVNVQKAKRLGIDYLVASSFRYERYFIGAQLSGQHQSVQDMHERYVRLFSNPYVEISPAHKSFAFSNPVIRIVDISESN